LSSTLKGKLDEENGEEFMENEGKVLIEENYDKTMKTLEIMMT
jgi:hypothetical protein